MITKDTVRSASDALIYFADCSAATCWDYTKKRVSESAFLRHVSITERAIAFARQYGGNAVEIQRVEQRVEEAKAAREANRAK